MEPKEGETRLTIVHMVTPTIFPQPGGLELSVLRIATSLASSGDFRIVVYTRKQAEEFRRSDPRHGDVEIVHLSCEKSFLMEPLGADMPLSERVPNSYSLESMRLDVMLLRFAVQARMDQEPDAKHVLVSFFISTDGFVAQHVALAL